MEKKKNVSFGGMGTGLPLPPMRGPTKIPVHPHRFSLLRLYSIVKFLENHYSLLERGDKVIQE